MAKASELRNTERQAVIVVALIDSTIVKCEINKDLCDRVGDLWRALGLDTQYKLEFINDAGGEFHGLTIRGVDHEEDSNDG